MRKNRVKKFDDPMRFLATKYNEIYLHNYLSARFQRTSLLSEGYLGALYNFEVLQSNDVSNSMLESEDRDNNDFEDNIAKYQGYR